MTTAKSVDEILDNLDVFADDQRENFVEALAVARQKCSVLHTESDGGYYLITKYADVRTYREHREIFSSHNPAVKGELPLRPIPLDTDPPDHKTFRSLLDPYFLRLFLAQYEDDMRARSRATRSVSSSTPESSTSWPTTRSRSAPVRWPASSW